jgi:hypothetical protein
MSVVQEHPTTKLKSVESEVRPKIREDNGLQQIKPEHLDENLP